MKFFIVIISSMLLSVSGFCQYHFTLKGKTPDYFNNKNVYLTIYDNYSNDRYVILDSAIVKNNIFSFSGNMPKTSESANLSYVNDQKYSKEFVLDSGQIFMDVNPVPQGYKFYKNKLSLLKVKNSISNQILTKIDSIHYAFMDLYGYYTDSTKQYKVLHLEKELECQNAQRQITGNYRDNYYSLIYLYKLSYTLQKPDSILKSFNLLSNNLKSSRLGQELGAKMNDKISTINSVQASKDMPIFNVKTYRGDLLNNKTLKGFPYLVVFSATWCIPCREDLPTIVNLYNRYKIRGLKVVYFNLDDNRKKWEHEISDNKLEWINVSEGVKWTDSKIAKQFDISKVPTYILVDRNGKIIFNSDKYNGDRLIALDYYIEKNLK